MNTESIRQAVRYTESLKEDMELLMKAGDIADGTNRYDENIDQKFQEAKKLLSTNMTTQQIAEATGINRTTLIRLLRAEGIPTNRDRRSKPQGENMDEEDWRYIIRRTER